MWNKIAHRFSGDIRDVMTLMVGNGLALALPVLVSPLLTRIYDVGDFANFTIYTALVGFVSAFASGRYEYAILVARSQNAARHLYKLAILFLLMLTLIVATFVVGFNVQLLELMNVPNLGMLLYLVPVNIFLFTLIRINHNGLNREKAYSVISFSKSIRSFMVGGVQLLLGFTGWIAGGLIIGKLAGDLLTAGYLSKKLDTLHHYLREKTSFKRMGYLARKHKRYPQINSFHALLNALSNNSIPILIGLFFTEETVGLFGLSFMVCMMPVQLIGTAVYQVFSQKVSAIYNDKGDVLAYTRKTLLTLAKVAVVPFLLLTLFAPQLFAFIFGSEWVASGEYTQILAPYLFVVFLLSPLTYLPLVYNEHKKALYFEMLSSTFKLLSILIGAQYGGIYTALLLFSVTGILIHLATLWWLIGIPKKA